MIHLHSIAKKARKVMFQAQVNLTGGAASGGTPLLVDLFNPGNDLGAFFNSAFKFAIVAGAILAVLRLGLAGISYMMTDLPGVKISAKDKISGAITGLLLLLAIWLILNQINPDLLNLDALRSVRSTP